MSAAASKRRVVLATANPDKAREISVLLHEAGVEIEVVARPADVGEVKETGATLEENARLKAEALRDATGLPALADDTGLEVDALGGAPGVHSARYAGDDASYADNVIKLLEALTAIGRPGRTARFRTVVVLSAPDGTEVVAAGTLEGVIAPEPRGRGGFGYDPVFVPVGGGGRTFGEMTPDEKNRVSHRARALWALAEQMRDAVAG